MVGGVCLLALRCIVCLRSKNQKDEEEEEMLLIHLNFFICTAKEWTRLYATGA